MCECHQFITVEDIASLPLMRKKFLKTQEKSKCMRNVNYFIVQNVVNEAEKLPSNGLSLGTTD